MNEIYYETLDKMEKAKVAFNNAQKIIEYLYQKPLLNVQKAKEITGLSLPSAYKLIDELENLNIINEITGGKRGRLYLYREYIKLFD